MPKTTCDVCERRKDDHYLNSRNGMIVCDDCIEAEREGAERMDNGRNTGGKSYR